MYSFRKIEFASNIFGGYYIWLDISKYKSKDEIIQKAKHHLCNFLQTFNLHYLSNYANEMELIISSYNSYDDILKKTSITDAIYIYEVVT